MMRYQEQLVRMTQKALDDIGRAAAAVPDEYQEWSPGGNARSVLSQMQEVAAGAQWFLPIVRDRTVPEFDDHARREAIRLRQSFKTMQDCIEAAQSGTSELCAAILEFPDESLEEEIRLPFGGGSLMTMADVLAMHYWNMVYHHGQINQIQLLQGDQEMH